MTLPRDLADVASELAQSGTTRPKQAHLRRALSTAYYAAFHFLLEAASRQVAGTGQHNSLARAFVARGITHKNIKGVCLSVSKGQWPSEFEARLGCPLPPPTQRLRDVGATFVSLQALRHDADYNSLIRFSRANVIANVQRVTRLMTDWDAVGNDERDYFLLALALLN